MHWQVHKDGATDWRATSDRLDVGVAIGCDPIVTFTASAPLPREVDELMLAGYLRGAPVEVVRAKTVDLEVPAHAEIILEGYVQKGDVGIEGPFGDHTGYYTQPEPFPIFHISCMTMRRDAIYPSLVVGVPPAEDAWLGKASERLAMPALRAAQPEIVDLDLPVAGAFQHCAIVSIRKSFPGHAKKTMYALWGTGIFALLKCIVVVDDFVDVHDYEQVFFHTCANVDPKRDCLVAEGPLDQLDHSALLHCYGGKLGIDATHKWESEGARAWPERIAMSNDVGSLVDERWVEYGLGIDFVPGRESFRKQI
jgi:4-hydroxy-3-polyprenylbenzoate decarboxylase